MGVDTERRASYLQKLRDPRWQRRRLEIMQRDEFTCVQCCDTRSTLNVHHKYYRPNAEPWEYPDAALVTLCEACHIRETEAEGERRTAERGIIEVIREENFEPRAVEFLLSTIAYHRITPSILCEALLDATPDLSIGPLRVIALQHGDDDNAASN